MSNAEGQTYEQALQDEIEKLMSFPDERKRDEYVEGVLSNLREGLVKMRERIGVKDMAELQKMGMIDKAKVGKKMNDAMKDFGEQFNSNRIQYISVIFFCIKDEYRRDMIALVQEVFGALT